MSTEKTYGFGNSSPYRSDTFNKGNARLFGKNGPLKIGNIYNDGSDIVLEDIAFVQEGIMVKKTGAVRVTFPATLAAPFYLTATVPDTRPVDNIAWSFVRRPQDITANLALIAEWDGSEWRPLSSQSIKAILDYRLESAKAYNNLGFNQGFAFSPANDFSSYSIGAGQITDKTGSLITKKESTSFTEIPADPDFQRIDAILWRRATDNVNRIGQLIHRAAGTYAGSDPVQVKKLTVASSLNVNGKPKIFNLADNTYILLYIEGYGSNGVLKATKYSADRTTQDIAPTTMASGILEYSAALGSDGKLFVVYVKENNLYRMKIASDCTIDTGAALIESLSNPVLKPVVKSDAIGNNHCAFIYQSGPTTYVPYYMRFNQGGTVSVQPKRLLTNTSSYDQLDFDISDDLIISIAYNNTTSGAVELQTIDDVGTQITGIATISNDTKFNSLTLTTACRNVQVKCSENNELYITWEQEKGTNQYGFVMYNPKFKANFGSKAILHTFVTNTENIQGSKMEVDWGNHGHIMVGNGSKILYYKFFLPTLGTRLTGNFEVLASASSDFDIVFDKSGSLITTWAQKITAISNNGTALTDGIFGQGNFGTEGIFISMNEFAVPYDSISAFTPIPTVGDTVDVTLSTQGNNGSHVILQERVATINGATYRVFRTASTFGNENAGTVTLQFNNKAGNLLETAKQSAEVTYSFTEVLAEQLDSDTVGFMIHKPSNAFVTWYNNQSVDVNLPVVRGEGFLASEGAISWNSAVGGGTLNWSLPIFFRDPFRGDLEIASGSVSNLADGDVLYVKAPNSIKLTKDGNTDGINVASVDDNSQFSIGTKVLVGDSDSAGILTAVTAVAPGKITTAASLVGISVVRGAFIIPLDVTLLKTAQNTGDLRPNSLGEIDGRIATIATRRGGTVFFRGGSLALESGETGQLGDGTSDQTLAFIGAANETDATPAYGATGYLIDGQSLRVAISNLGLLLKTKGVSRIVWVSKDTGNDTTGDGSFYKPYLTVEATHTSITDADATKKVAVVLAPGDYIEADTFIHTKPYISYFSLVKDSATLKRVTLPFAFSFSAASRTEVQGIKFTNGLTFTKVVSTPGNIHLEVKDSTIESSDAIFNGTGLSDIVLLNNVYISSSLRLHSCWAVLKATDVDGVTEADDDFGPGYLGIQASYLNNIITQSVVEPIHMEILSSKVAGSLTIDHLGSVLAPKLSIDASSYPATEAQLTLTNDAELVRLTKAFAVDYTPAVASDYSEIDSAQPVTSRDALDKLASLSRYFSQLKLSAHETDSNKVRISGADITLLDGRVLTQELRNLVMNFEGAVINFTTGQIFAQDGVTSLGLDFTPYAIPVSEYAWYGVGIIPSTVGLDNTINVQVLVTAPNGSSLVSTSAPLPVIAGTKKLGGVLIQNNTGNMELSLIRQLGTGSGSGDGGVGDLTAVQSELRSALRDGEYNWLAEIDFRVDTDTYTNSGTAEFDVANQVYNFENSGDELETINLYNEDFLNSSNDSMKLEFHVFGDPDNLDEAFTLEATQDGSSYETITMEQVAGSPHFVATKTLSPTYSELHGYSAANADSALAFTSTVSRVAIPFIVGAKQAVKDVTLLLNKTGNPSGFFTAGIYTDNGNPLTLVTSLPTVFFSTLAAGNISSVVTLGRTVLTPGTYWLVVEVDAAYMSSYAAGTTLASLRVDATAPTYTAGLAKSYNGAWSSTTVSPVFSLSGFLYDLKLKYTAGNADSNLIGLGVLFEEEGISFQEGEEKNKFFYVNGDSDTTEFELDWYPDPKRLKVYDANVGQVYTWPKFTVDGNTVVFPVGTFLVAGQMFFLQFDESENGSFDSSEQNANLLSTNHLGSTDPTADRSIAGRGILVRNLQGALKELWIDGESIYVTDPK